MSIRSPEIARVNTCIYMQASNFLRCDLWSCDVPKSKLSTNLKYRFYVAEMRTGIEDDHDKKKLVVLAWESRLKPREFNLAGRFMYNFSYFVFQHLTRDS